MTPTIRWRQEQSTSAHSNDMQFCVVNFEAFVNSIWNDETSTAVNLDAKGELACICNADQTTLPIQQTSCPTQGACSFPISEYVVTRNARQKSDQNKFKVWQIFCNTQHTKVGCPAVKSFLTRTTAITDRSIVAARSNYSFKLLICSSTELLQCNGKPIQEVVLTDKPLK